MTGGDVFASSAFGTYFMARCADRIGATETMHHEESTPSYPAELLLYVERGCFA